MRSRTAAMLVALLGHALLGWLLLQGSPHPGSERTRGDGAIVMVTVLPPALPMPARAPVATAPPERAHAAVVARPALAPPAHALTAAGHVLADSAGVAAAPFALAPQAATPLAAPGSVSPTLAQAAPTPPPSPSDTTVAAQTAQATQADHRDCARAPHPAVLRERGIEGVVTLRVQVDTQGRAAAVRLLATSGWHLFDEAALRQARGCRFMPALRAGQPVESWVEFPVRFALAG